MARRIFSLKFYKRCVFPVTGADNVGIFRAVQPWRRESAVCSNAFRNVDLPKRFVVFCPPKKTSSKRSYKYVKFVSLSQGGSGDRCSAISWLSSTLPVCLPRHAQLIEKSTTLNYIENYHLDYKIPTTNWAPPSQETNVY